MKTQVVWRIVASFPGGNEVCLRESLNRREMEIVLARLTNCNLFPETRYDLFLAECRVVHEAKRGRKQTNDNIKY